MKLKSALKSLIVQETCLSKLSLVPADGQQDYARISVLGHWWPSAVVGPGPEVLTHSQLADLNESLDK